MTGLAWPRPAECQPNHNPTYCDDYLEPSGNEILNFSGLTWPDGAGQHSISSIDLTTAS